MESPSIGGRALRLNLWRVGARARTSDIGSERAQRLLASAGRELREARRDRDLSLATVARAAGTSGSTLSRIERGQLRNGSLLLFARIGAVVGLELSVRFYPGGQPVRDVAQLALLAAFRARLHPSLRMRSEVPLDLPGDQRAWDAVVIGRASGERWSIGVEAETGPADVQAVQRRLNLKLRDGDVDHVVLLLSDTLKSRQFLAAGGDALLADFPVTSDRALAELAAGRDPGGNAIVVLPRRDRRGVRGRCGPRTGGGADPGA